MYRVLARYNLITTLPFKDTFFYTTTLPRKIKLSRQLLSLNYKKHSPYKDSDFVSLTLEKHLLIWFYKKKIDFPIAIPESFLAFKELRKNHEDAIYIINADITKILIIKNSIMVSAFTLENLDEMALNLSMDEFQVSNKIEINEKTYDSLIKKALKDISFKDMYLFKVFTLDKKVFLKTLVDKASYPILFLVLFSMLVSYTQATFLKSDIEKLQNRYQLEKKKNRDIKRDIKIHNKGIKRWKKFAQEELLYPNPAKILESIYTVFTDYKKANILYFTASENKLLLKIQTDKNPIDFLNRLNDIKYFSRVVIQNSYKPRNGKKIITYDIAIKPSKDL